jgi:glycosyltransferase involved in cell wall biosynthesis
MKILLINNFSEKLLLGGVENYLLEFTEFAKKNNPKTEFYWYGKDSKKINFIQKIYNYKTTKEIIRVIDAFQPNVIHCFSIGAPVTPHFMKYAAKKNIPILYSFRDYYYVCPKNYMLTTKGKIIDNHRDSLSCILHHHPKKNLIYDVLLSFKQSYHKNFIQKYATYFLTPSENLTISIKNHFNLNGETLYNPTMLENDNSLRLNEDYLLYVGRLDREKGVLTLLKAYKNILKNYPQEKLLIVGEGNQMEEITSFKEENNLTNLHIVGKKNREELKVIYSKAKFTIVPSEILESYGNVILESFVFKKTVIISNLLGITKDIETSNSGIVFPFGNIEKLTESMELLLVNTTLRNELAENGFELAKSRSFETHFNKQLEIYNRLAQ